MKAYFIGNDFMGCFYVRCLLPMVYNGWDGVRTSLRSDRSSPKRVSQGIQNADIVVIHRPLEEQAQRVFDIVRKVDKKVVIDNDDTFIPDSGVPTEMVGDLTDEFIEGFHENLTDNIKAADLVTTSTGVLKEEYEHLHDNVKVLPNYVDPLDWPNPKKNDKDTVRIGVVGSAASSDNYKHISEVLKSVSEHKKVEFIVFAFPRPEEEHSRDVYREYIDFWESIGAKMQHHVPMHQYFRVLNNLRIDLMLIPRDDSYFNRAKSNIKFLEASMLGIPCISQGFDSGDSPYERKKEDAEHQIIANTDDEWMDAIMDMVENEERRRDLGETAREYVIDNYNIEDNAHKWEDAYQSIID